MQREKGKSDKVSGQNVDNFLNVGEGYMRESFYSLCFCICYNKSLKQKYERD